MFHNSCLLPYFILICLLIEGSSWSDSMFVFDDRNMHGILDKESEPDQQHSSLTVLESPKSSSWPQWLCSESCHTQQGSGILFVFIVDEGTSQVLSLHVYTAPRRFNNMLYMSLPTL